MNEDKFIKEVTKLKIKLTSKTLKDLKIYYQTLVVWNKKINLTAIIKEEDVYLKHFYDSLTLVKIHNFKKPLLICDIGSGAGFPGLVLKIFFPQLKITLIESKTKKTLFLKEVVKLLKLKEVKIINKRAEEYAKNNLKIFDVITMRAVGNINLMLKTALLMIKDNGFFLIMKGKKEDEAKNMSLLLSNLKSKLVKIKRFTLPIENSHRHLLKIKKLPSKC